MSLISDEVRTEIILEYKNRMSELPEEERAIKTIDIVKDLATEYDLTPNAVRFALQKDGCYIKKATATSTKAASTTKRMSKEAAHQFLRDAITATKQEPNDEVITKLSGVAAQYLGSVIMNAMEVGE